MNFPIYGNKCMQKHTTNKNNNLPVDLACVLESKLPCLGATGLEVEGEIPRLGLRYQSTLLLELLFPVKSRTYDMTSILPTCESSWRRDRGGRETWIPTETFPERFSFLGGYGFFLDFDSFLVGFEPFSASVEGV